MEDLDRAVDYFLSNRATDATADWTDAVPQSGYAAMQQQQQPRNARPWPQSPDAFAYAAPTSDTAYLGIPLDRQLSAALSPLAANRLHASTRSGASPVPGGISPPADASATRVYDRIMRWAGKRLERRHRKAEEEEAHAAALCPFQPSRPTEAIRPESLPPSALYHGNRAWGHESFVARQAEARQRREEQKAFEASVWSVGENDRWRPRGQTIPKPFNLGRTARYQRPKTMFDVLAPVVRREFQHEQSEIEAPAVPAGLFSMQSTAAILDHSPRRVGLSARSHV